MNTDRRHDIDWLRVIAIGLLLIYHIAIIFQPWAMFIGFIRSDESVESIWIPMTLLNVWRIPLLFYVSGMGMYFAMRKRNWKQLIIERSKRILLPFAFGYIAITPLHMFVFQKYYNMDLQYYSHIGHLWFLGNIFFYVIIFLPFFAYLKKENASRFKKAISKIMSFAIGPLSISLFAVLELVAIRPQMYELYAQTWHGFWVGFVAFFFGFLIMYSGRSFWKTVSKYKWLYIVIASVLFTIRFKQFELLSTSYSIAIESTCWILGVFGLAHRYLNKPSAALTYLSRAAYPIYIIHMFVLFAGALVILPLDIHPLLQFSGICLFTFFWTYFIYELIIRRINFLRPLFGLKMYIPPSRKLAQSTLPIVKK
ncbi:acyltransferase family protein [Portibacter lacus]|uniref:acyltransferase family protein n=1 Tax=Portibacter lacus TaxID=1099794 RepID=UPI001F425E62|nr:acyltransferase family protein [Portibacter lacus]